MEYTIAELLGMKESLKTQYLFLQKCKPALAEMYSTEMKVEYSSIMLGDIKIPKIEKLLENTEHIRIGIEKISKLILEESIKLVDTL